MDWFERTYPWIPKVDSEGHPLGPGLIALHRVPCNCTAVTDGRGHDVANCRNDGCPAMYGPGGCLGLLDAH